MVWLVMVGLVMVWLVMVGLVMSGVCRGGKVDGRTVSDVLLDLPIHPKMLPQSVMPPHRLARKVTHNPDDRARPDDRVDDTVCAREAVSLG